MDNPNDTPCPQRRRTNIVSSSSNNKTILDIVTHLIALGSLVGIGFVFKISDSVEPKDMNLEKYRWIPLYIQLYGPVIAVIATLAILLTMNCAILKKIPGKLFAALP